MRACKPSIGSPSYLLLYFNLLLRCIFIYISLYYTFFCMQYAESRLPSLFIVASCLINGPLKTCWIRISTAAERERGFFFAPFLYSAFYSDGVAVLCRRTRCCMQPGWQKPSQPLLLLLLWNQLVASSHLPNPIHKLLPLSLYRKLIG